MTIANKLKKFTVSWKEKISVNEQKRALILLFFQIAILLLLGATLIFIFYLDFGYRRIFYFSLVLILMLLLGIALVFSLSSKYKISALVTIFCILIGPWASILFDPKIISGDLIPLVYTVLAIDLCAIFLSEKITAFIATIQLIALIVFIQSSPYLMKENWPSLILYVIFSIIIGIIISVINRKQLEQIEAQTIELFDNTQQLRELAIRDPVTGLFNRLYMEEALDREMDNALNSKQNLGIIMADIDGFKNINDTYGHAIGDKVLIQIANVIKMETKEPDIACRFGGDEIILILKDSSLENTCIKAEKIRNAINSIAIKSTEHNLIEATLSFGAAAFPESGMSIKDVLIAADKALYVAKKEGGNKVISGPVLLS